MKAARVAEDDRSPRGGERPNCFVRNTALHDLLGHAAVPHRPPRTHVVMRPSGLTARHILERAGFLVDVVEVEERLQQMLVVEVVMPELRRDAVCLGRLRHRVPEVDVRKLRPHAQIRVRDGEHVRRQRRAQPRVVEAEPDAVEAVSPDEELLAGAAAKLRAPVLVLLAQATLRVRRRRRPLLEHGVAQSVVGDELVEAQRRVALPVDGLEDVALDVVEAGGLVRRGGGCARLERRRSCRRYVATIPVFSTAFATGWARPERVPQVVCAVGASWPNRTAR